MLKILVVEHEDRTRDRYTQELEGAGYRVIATGNPLEGLSLIESASPDLVVLEAHLPGADGMQTMSQVMDRHPRIPVLMVSEDWSEEDSDVRRAADACVTPKSGTGALRAKVRQLLEPHAF